jgi:hypothetical protein
MTVAVEQGNDKERELWDERLGFYTPILKGFLTELGFECTNLGVQVFGGHGYIGEHGMEQIVRDTRIATLYEGTTGIQALDLLGRKVLVYIAGCKTSIIRHPAHAGSAPCPPLHAQRKRTLMRAGQRVQSQSSTTRATPSAHCSTKP